MSIRVGINGFGRIGRIALRLVKEYPDLQIVAVNDVVPADTLAHLFEFDSTHGRYKGDVAHDNNSLRIDGKKIPLFSGREPTAIPWKEVGADIVLECSGFFTTKETAQGHLKSGVKKVIISAPATGQDATFVYGVNHKNYDSAKHTVISNASCTTNCLAPMVYVLHKNFGVEKGFMTTVHSYTNDQKILDAPHKDLRRARAGAANQIPTTTGAAKAVGEVLPELKGKLDGMSIRVPTSNVSCTDLVAVLKKEATADQVNAALKSAAAGELKGVLGVEERELVSSDFLGDRRSSIIDAPSTKANGTLVKVLSWYDNEVGFSYRLLDMTKYIGERL
ncbi:MAG: type I glyceraldehyde-3-phosphate dehydrogenase [Deltaproteobacteria bacterium]|nr:type I glyceraldehyde-3-phosphate dehydrogenase [Deltaproteobacteria bacterium]